MAWLPAGAGLHLHVGETPDKGKGVFAGKPYRRGDLIFVIAGPVSARFTRYTIPIDERLAIDPVPVDNVAAYLNHSCEPKAGIRGRSVGMTLRDVSCDEEVAIDYAMIVDEYGSKIAEDELVCRCGAPICRGRLGAYNRLPSERRQRYRGYISDSLLQA